MKPSLEHKLDHLSKKPGVYLFKNAKGDILYIGKAKVLRNRVRSYFQDSRRLDPKTQRLINKVRDFETIITDTEVEALILEANLVKEYKPRYNINLKDDKSFPYIRVTHEPFPRIFPTRKIIRDGSQYFGPYTDVQSMKGLLKTIKQLFPIRSCTLPLTKETIEAGKYKVCLNYHINRCYGPCEGHITQDEYGRLIDNIVRFIKGDTAAIEDDLRQRMQAASKKLEFEEAARLRDQLESVQMFSNRQKVFDATFADRDIIATALNDEGACSVVFTVRHGTILSKNHFILTSAEGESVATVTKAFLQQYYLKTDDIPPEVLVPVDFGDEHEAIQAWLAHRLGGAVNLEHPQDSEKQRLLRMCARNAKYHLDEYVLQKMQKKEYVAGSVKALQKALNLPKPPKRIEGFDISNIQGTNPVASMVSFFNGQPDKSKYRKFKIRSKHTPDDFAMMHEAVKRRYSRLLREEKPLPDLILIDGGKGQLNAAVTALQELELDSQPIISLAKRLEEVFIPGLPEAQNIPKDSSALRLLQRVRDESHRFAVTFHRQLRQKRTLVSALDDIPAVGPKRKQVLLKTFKSIENVKKATIEELAAVDGISETLARDIYDYLHEEKPAQRESEGADGSGSRIS